MGQDAVGWVSGWYFTSYGVRELVGLDAEAQGNSCYGDRSVPEMFVL